MKQPELGRKIVEFRNEKGLTQEQLSDRSNINIRTLQRIEAGEVTPRTFTLKILLEILDKDYSEINGNTDLQVIMNSSALKKARNAGIILLVCNAFYLVIVLLRDLYGIRSGIYHMNILILVTMFISTIFFNLGFVHLGKTINNQFLLITGIIGIILTFFCDIVYIGTFYSASSTIALIAKLLLIMNAINGVFYGVGILFLRKYFNDLATLSGVIIICVSILYIFPIGIMEVVALILSVPSMLIQVLILMKLLQKQQIEVVYA